MPAHVKKAARTYMFASVLLRGRGIFNSHFNIFSDCHLARSSHLWYVTCAWHIPPATAMPPAPSSPLRAHPTPRCLHALNPTAGRGRVPGASAAGVRVGLGAPHRPVSPRHTPPHPSHPLRSLQCPLSPVASVQWERRWVIGSRLEILIIHEAGKALGGGGVCWGGGGVGR